MSNSKPDWLKKRLSLNYNNIKEVKKLVDASNLHTVCQSAKCPNIFECFSKKCATFMLMGNRCLRNCAFCGISHKHPLPLDENEPRNVAIAASKMGLRYVVLTSVTRDDLTDCGAEHFVKTIREIKKMIPSCQIECLIPDLKGNKNHLRKIVSQPINVLNHNIETIKKNYPQIRPTANYHTSLNILKEAKKIKKDITTKSGFMVGLGETMEELKVLLEDLNKADCDMVTIGQYLSPSLEHIAVKKYYSSKEFEYLEKLAKEIGIQSVTSGIFVRSSFNAALMLKGIGKTTNGNIKKVYKPVQEQRDTRFV